MAEDNKMQEINIEQIMEEIRNEIKEKGLTEDMLSFEDAAGDMFAASSNHFSMSQFSREIDHMYERYTIAAWRPLESRPTGLVKKMIRKLTKFYVEPIANDQTGFNEHVAKAMNEMRKYIYEQERVINDLKAEIEQLKARL